jgi:hypothetical protein
VATVTNPADRQAIEHFVRGTLGCGCPDEVFNAISVERPGGPDPSAPYVRLLVGNRLLIYVIEPRDVGQARAAVSELARLGIEQRNSAGLNRFRLVVAADQATPVATAASAVFSDAIGHDDHAHLHVIAADLVPASLR